MIAIALPAAIMLTLMIWQIVLIEIRDRRGSALFMRETGRSKTDWNLLGNRQKADWVRKDREHREWERFAIDFKKGRAVK